MNNTATDIEGVKIKKLNKLCDDRGFLMEVLRKDDDLLGSFGQLTFTVAFPGVIKAFHYHKKQDDLWFCPFGNIQIALFDMRENSSTHGKLQVVFAGENNPVLVLIPKMVAHGYRVLGQKEAGLFYVTTKEYDRKNPDEFRLPFDDPQIGMDWTTQCR